MRKLLLCLMFSSVCAQADHYVELRGGFGFGELTYEDDDDWYDDNTLDVNTLDFVGKFYFYGASAERGPIAELGFLSQSPYMQLSLSQTSKDDSTNFYADRDINEQSFGGRFIFPDVPLFIGGAWVDESFEYSSGFERERQGYRIEFGGYVSDSSALWVERIASEIDMSSLNGTRDETTTTINYKHINVLGGRKSLVWTLQFEESDAFDLISFAERRSIGGAIKFYVTEKIGFGAGMRMDDYTLNYSEAGSGIDVSGAVFTPEFSYDFDDNIGMYVNARSEAIIVEYSNSFGSDETISEVIFRIGLTGRF